MAQDISRNTIIPMTNTMTGSFYAFNAAGGFVMERSFEKIELLQDSSFAYIDVTDSVQILMDVRRFNAKLGLYKDASNCTILYRRDEGLATTYDGSNQEFFVDEISISSDELQYELRHLPDGSNSIVSVGKYENLYKDFEQFVRVYFGYFGGFATLFNNSSNFDISTNFDKEELHNLMTNDTSDNSTGAYIKDMSGSIVISNITELLRRAVDADIFNNRDPSGESYEDSDVSFNAPTMNFGVGDGFIAGDLIYVPSGTQITLQLQIAPENYLPINNVGPLQSGLTGLTAQQNTLFSNNTNQQLTVSQLGGGFSSTTTTSNTHIVREIKAPLLIRLANLSNGYHVIFHIQETYANVGDHFQLSGITFYDVNEDPINVIDAFKYGTNNDDGTLNEIVIDHSGATWSQELKNVYDGNVGTKWFSYRVGTVKFQLESEAHYYTFTLANDNASNGGKLPYKWTASNNVFTINENHEGETGYVSNWTNFSTYPLNGEKFKLFE